MPKRRSAVKRIRVDSKRHRKNLAIKKELKKILKKFAALMTAKNAAEAKKLLSTVFAQLDKAAKKRIIHPRMADRKKSRLAKSLAKVTKA